jgi:hypothetical protein
MLSVRAGQIEKLAVLYERHRMPLLNFFVRLTGIGRSITHRNSPAGNNNVWRWRVH